MRLGGIQPVYLPWLGYFDQMRRVDVFLIADEMPYSSGWFHRNRVKGPSGPAWLTLPARPQESQRICEVPLSGDGRWARKHLATLHHFYARGIDIEDTLGALTRVLDPSAHSLAQITVATIRYLAEELGVRTPILLSSELGLEAGYQARFADCPSATHRIVAYMEALGATELLEGESGQSYFDVPLFNSFGNTVQFHRYAHPTYPQLHGPFQSHMSAVDLLLCVGREEARRVLASGGLRDA